MDISQNIGSAPTGFPLKSWREHINATLKLGIPLVGSQLGLMAMNTTDTVMLGWYSIEALAAGVLATQYFFIIMICGAGIGQAITPMVAQAAGAGDERMSRRVLRMGLWIAVAYSSLVLPLFIFSEQILLALGQEPRIAALAGDYLHIAMWAMFPTLLSHSLRSFLSAIELTRMLLIITVLAILANVAINWVLIFGNWGAPRLGIEGAAYATLLVNILMFIAMALYIAYNKKTQHYDVFARLWRPDWPAFFDVLRVGTPIGIAILAEAGMFIFASIMMGWLGVVALAAHGIALQLASISFMIPLGMSQVATIRISNAFGRGDIDNLFRAANSVLFVGLFASFIAASLFFLFPDFLIGMFLDESKPDVDAVASYAVALLFVAAIFQFLDGAQVTAAAQLRGLKDTKIPMALAIFSYWGVGLVISYILGIYYQWGGVGVWIGLAVGLGVSSVLLLTRFNYVRPRSII